MQFSYKSQWLKKGVDTFQAEEMLQTSVPQTVYLLAQ